MLPTKVFQIDYQEISNIVETHIDNILKYELENNIKFDCILAKLRNGTIAGSIISNYLQVPMGVIEITRENKECSLFLPISIVNKINSKENVNILFVDGICGTGETLKQAEEYIKLHAFKDYINLITYCTFIDSNAKHKPIIEGMVVVDKFIQPPWEWRSYTPQVHLDRLEANDIKASTEREYCIGFLNNSKKQDFLDIITKKDLDWSMVFSDINSNFNSASGVSSYSVIPKEISMSDCYGKFNSLLKSKVDFISLNGLTHYVEDDMNQAIYLSIHCPICHILIIKDNKLFRISGKEIKKENLNFID